MLLGHDAAAASVAASAAAAGVLPPPPPPPPPSPPPPTTPASGTRSGSGREGGGWPLILRRRLHPPPPPFRLPPPCRSPLCRAARPQGAGTKDSGWSGCGQRKGEGRRGAGALPPHMQPDGRVVGSRRAPPPTWQADPAGQVKTRGGGCMVRVAPHLVAPSPPPPAALPPPSPHHAPRSTAPPVLKGRGAGRLCGPPPPPQPASAPAWTATARHERRRPLHRGHCRRLPRQRWQPRPF